ncbi:MAG: phage head-tail joining protein [Candidatus Nanopelagicaceae bacterium]
MATLADLTAIEAAINSGATKVKYQDREVTYNSLAELYKIRDNLKQELGLSTNGKRPYRIQAVFDSGL